MSTVIDLHGKRGLIIGVANERSIAWGCAKVLHQGGAQLALTYLNDKAKAFVAPLAQQVDASIFLPLDVTQEEQSKALFDTIAAQWGSLDFLIHAIAYAPKEDLHGRVVDSSKSGFLQAMDISCHSFMRLAKAAEALMPDGGSLLTMSYYGAKQVVPHYGMMGAVKAALEQAAAYMALELGCKNIRVNTLSPGPVATRAASGILGFDAMLEYAVEKAPLHRSVSPEDVGHLAAFLVSDLSHNITGGVHYVDAGYEVVD